MIKFFKRTLLLIITPVLLIAASPVFAVTAMPDIVRKPNIPPGITKKLTSTETEGVTASKAGNKRSLLKVRLDEVKLKICQIKEKVIVKRSDKMVEHANRIIAVFDSIVTRVTNYYQSRLVSQGRTLSNYDSLLLTIQSKRNAITPLIEAAQTDAANFKCDGDDPKGQLEQFKQDIKAVIPGLKAYKIAVRNLIVAVASLTGAGEKTATGSAVPTVEPTVLPTAAPTL